MINCLYCNSEIDNINKNRKYCSSKCSKLWRRQNIIAYPNQSNIRALKRDYPQDRTCEICGEYSKVLQYHHWSIKNSKAYGLWCCASCHFLANITDKRNITEKLIKIYLDKKQTINSNW